MSRLGNIPGQASGAARYAQALPKHSDSSAPREHASKSRVTLFLSLAAQERLRAILGELQRVRVTVTNEAGEIQRRKPSASMLVDVAILALDAGSAKRLLDEHEFT